MDLDLEFTFNNLSISSDGMNLDQPLPHSFDVICIKNIGKINTINDYWILMNSLFDNDTFYFEEGISLTIRRSDHKGMMQMMSFSFNRVPTDEFKIIQELFEEFVKYEPIIGMSYCYSSNNEVVVFFDNKNTDETSVEEIFKEILLMNDVNKYVVTITYLNPLSFQ